MERSASTNAIPNNPIPFINALRNTTANSIVASINFNQEGLACCNNKAHKCSASIAFISQGAAETPADIDGTSIAPWRIQSKWVSQPVLTYAKFAHFQCCKIFTIVLLALSILHVDLLLASFFGLVLITNFKRDPCLYMACIIYNVSYPLFYWNKTIPYRSGDPHHA